MIPPQLVIGATVGGPDINSFVFCWFSGHSESQTDEPACIGCRTSPGLSSQVHLNRAVMEGRAWKYNNPATLMACGGRHPNGFTTLIRYCLYCYTVGLQSVGGVERERLPGIAAGN